MSLSGPVIVWFRRDLRLGDNPALAAAVATGRPVLALFIHDETVETLGAAPRFRLGLGLAAFADALAGQGARLVLRRGRALEVLQALVAETGAGAIHWTRYHEPAHIARDRAVKLWAAEAGIEARSFAGALLHEPLRLLTGAGRPYSVFTPFWRRLAASPIDPPLAAPAALTGPVTCPPSDRLADWAMDGPMGRGARVVAGHVSAGEAAARARLERFLAERAARYSAERDRPDLPATSGLSENLAWGEISPRQIWHRALAAGEGTGAFLRELGWRDFAWHLMAHFPGLATDPWRADWDGFAWRPDNADAEAWRRGQTGVPLVDAGMRELFVTGRMHNRVRMVAASYLTKHLLTDWRVGLAWFADCLIDWDPAVNATSWQWVAGSGPDAAPFFRIFNPLTQAERFDPDARYRRRFLREPDGTGTPEALAFAEAAPRTWGRDPVGHAEVTPGDLAAGRARALAAYARFRSVAGGRSAITPP